MSGRVRDLLWGAESHDRDICTSARPEETEACFAGRQIVETGFKYGTVTVLEEDGLRIMRALRSGATLGYELEEHTAQAVHDNRSMLGRVAAERINVELCQLLLGERAGAILRRYPDVLCQFWPDLEPLVTLVEYHDVQIPCLERSVRGWLGRLGQLFRLVLQQFVKGFLYAASHHFF